MSMSGSPHSQRDGRLSLIAIMQMLGGGMCFAVMNGIIKWLGQRYDVPTIFLWRSASAFLIILPLLCLRGGVGGLRTVRLFGHSIRGVFGVAGTLCFFWTVTQLPLGTAVTLAYAWPVFMLGIAVWVLREPASWTGALVALLGFCGVALICGFAWSASGPGMIAGLASAVLFACAYASMKSIANTETPIAISFYFHVWCTLAGLVLSIPHWTWPVRSDVPALLATGVFGGLAQCLIASAFRRGSASQLASLDYATVIWSVLIGWAVWGEIPNLAGLAGAVLIAASGIAMAKTRQPTRERRENPPIKPFGDVPRAAMVETLELGPDNRFAAGPTLSPLSRLRGNVIK
jgi:drug/metabolite transporter (DMT)-like permease